MNNYENKPGTGTIWKNDKYEKGGKYPYANGIIKGFNGEDLDVALWIPKSDKIKGFNLTMKPFEKKVNNNAANNSYATSAPEEVDDLPFH